MMSRQKPENSANISGSEGTRLFVVLVDVRYLVLIIFTLLKKVSASDKKKKKAN